MLFFPSMRIACLTLILCLAGMVGCATQSAPPAPPPKPPLEFLGEWGPRGDGPGQLSRPVSLAVDSVGNVYIADAGSRFVHKFDPNGRPLLSFQDLYLKSPQGIAVDAGGGIYVTDEKANLLFIFRTDGSRYQLLRSAGGRRFKNPAGVSVDSSGEIFLLDSEGVVAFYPGFRQSAVQRLAMNGEPRDTGATTGDVQVGWGRSVYTIWGATLVEKRDATGEAVAWSHRFSEPLPQGAASAGSGISASGHLVFVADGSQQWITILTTEGVSKHRESFAKLPRGERPTQIADLAWSPRGELLLLDGGNARVLRFRVNL